MSTGRTETEDRSECTPCRGTGRLRSGKGGTPHDVICAWCGGDGRYHAGRDAQEHAPPAEPTAAGGADERNEG